MNTITFADAGLLLRTKEMIRKREKLNTFYPLFRNFSTAPVYFLSDRYPETETTLLVNAVE